MQLVTCVESPEHEAPPVGKLVALQSSTCTPPAPHVCRPALHSQLGIPRDPGACAENMQQVPRPAPGVVVPFA
jgi:hypothetical protein